MLHELCTKRQSEFQQIIAGVNERSLQVRNLKSEIESFETDPTKTSNDLAQIFDRMKLLKLENDKITAVDALQKLLEMEFDYQEQSDTVSRFFDPPGSLIFLNCCGVKPSELEIDLRDGHTRFNRNGSIFVKFPPSSLGDSKKSNIPYYLKMEATNLNTNFTELLPFQMTIVSSSTIGYEFNPTECCQYRIKCTLYDIPIRNSPVTIKVIQYGTTEVAEITEKVTFF